MLNTATFENALRLAPSKKAFLKTCDSLPLPDVRIDDDSLARYAESLTSPGAPYDWAPYHDAQNDLETDFLDLSVSTVQQGGYFYEDADHVQRLWTQGGSEINALLAKVNEARALEALPAVHIRDKAVLVKRLRHIFNDAPFSRERMAIWAELAGPKIAGRMIDVLRDHQTDTGYRFDFSTLKTLSGVLPKGFGEDPFLKKAGLLLILFAGVAHHKRSPGSVELDIVVPADWRDPQTLHGTGVLRYSDRLVDALDSGGLLPESHPFVTQIRVATVLAAERILEQQAAGLTMIDLDGLLWKGGKLFDIPAENLKGDDAKNRHALERFRWQSNFHDAGFRRVATQPMKALTLRF